MATEIELKLALDPSAMDALLRHPALRAVRCGRTRTARLVSAYYDAPGFPLAAAGIALRVRRIGRRVVQTIKGPPGPGDGAGLHARAEYEWPLPHPALDLRLLSSTPWHKRVAKAARKDPLVRCFTTDFERRSVPLRFPDGTLAVLCVDRGEIRTMRDGRTRRVPVAEIEIELQSGAAANLFDLALSLAADLPLALQTASKAERGFALWRGEPDLVGDGPVRAAGVTLDRDATLAAALAALVLACLHQIAANAAGLLADDDPEWVHQMRIGTRRLRSCLALVAPLAPSEALTRLRSDARWLAAALGAARDWDVFVRETLPPLALWFEHDAATAASLQHLGARAEARRRSARIAARKAVGSAQFQRLLLTGGLLCATPRLGKEGALAQAGPPDALDASARTFATTLLARRRRKLEKRATALAHGTPDERHAVRIAAKRLRYVGEFFASLFPRRRGRSYLKALAALQDVLGKLNDATTALSIAQACAGATAEAATGTLRGWVAAQAAALLPELVSVERRRARAKPFWTGK